MTSPQGCGRRRRCRSRRSGLRRARSSRVRRRARTPPPCRAAAHRARPIERRCRARPATAISPCPDKAARHRDRAAMAHRLPLRDQPRDLGAAFEARIDQAHRVDGRRSRHDRRQNAPTAAAPAFPRRCRARPGLRRSPPRIPAGSARHRYPRCAAATARRSRAPDRNSAVPNKHGRDADSRSGWREAENGWRHCISSVRAATIELLR